jgi:preprotein translocase subunit SecA
MLNLLKQLVDTNDREVRKAKKVVEAINALEPEMQEKSFEDMQSRINEIKAELRS